MAVQAGFRLMSISEFHTILLNPIKNYPDESLLQGPFSRVSSSASVTESEDLYV